MENGMTTPTPMPTPTFAPTATPMPTPMPPAVSDTEMIEYVKNDKVNNLKDVFNIILDQGVDLKHIDVTVRMKYKKMKEDEMNLRENFVPTRENFHYMGERRNIYRYPYRYDTYDPNRYYFASNLRQPQSGYWVYWRGKLFFIYE
jgi:hypothetical protein